MREGRLLNRAHVLRKKGSGVSWSEALILAQSDLPTTGALNPMIKWEKVVAKERVMRLLCCTCILQNCVVTVVIRVSRVVCIVCCVVAFSTPLQYFTLSTRFICIRVFDFYLLQPDSLDYCMC
jgi:hypothetical protein